jgi:eukaryotic-like serine/threonine-protein kinase
MPLAPGSRLGPYEIGAPLGAGGMGEVYRALDPKLQREVAIKVLPEALASNPQALARFEREARAVAALSHPHILAIHDFGAADGTAYAVMELLEGETLRAKLVGGPLPARKAAEYGAQLADGLASAHDKGIVHRDLKPENVFVTNDGRLKILDFGLALQGPGLADGDESHSPTWSRHTDPGTVLGTVGYMSPEQVRGRSVDHRSDIFSFGAILFEMVTGTRAFRRESSVETMNAILKEDPLDAPVAVGAVPPALERIMRRCLEKAPNERFQSARDLAFDLASLMGAATSGRPPVATAPSWRRPWILFGTAALLMAFAGGHWLGSFGGRRDGPRPIARYARLTEEPGLEQNPSLSPDGKTLVYAAGPLNRRGIYSRRVGGRNAVLLTKDCGQDNSSPKFSPDGERIAYRSECEDGGVFVMGASGESAKRVADLGHSPAWSPDGTRLVLATEAVNEDPLDRSTSELWVVTVDTGEKRRIWAGDAVQPAWSPGGGRVAFWGLRGNSGQRDLFTIRADGSGLTELTNDAAVDWAPQWSSDGHALYFASDRAGTMNVWRVPIDQDTGRTLGAPEPLGLPAFWTGSFSSSADGRTLAFVSAEPRSTVYTADFDPIRGSVTGTPHQVMSRSGYMYYLDWSPDGAWLALNDQYRNEEIFLIRPDGSGYRQLLADAFRNRKPRFSPDGKRIAFYSDRGGDYGAWSIRPDGSDLQRLSPTSLPGTIHSVWSPDGRRVAVSDSVSSIFILDLERPLADRQIETLLLSEPRPASFELEDWSSDGARLAVVGRGNDGVIRLFNYILASRTLEWKSDRVTWARLLTDGRRFVATNGNRLFLVDGVSRVTRDLLPPDAFPPHSSLIPAITRDARHIASSSGAPTATSGR